MYFQSLKLNEKDIKKLQKDKQFLKRKLTKNKTNKLI